MRTVPVAALGRPVSVIGFGCSSLGSRISAKHGRKALERAYEAGITWYDVAPSYGDGHAEGLLGDFAAGRRDDIVIATKVGILPPARSIVARTAMPIARKLVMAVPRMRAMATRLRAAPTKAGLEAGLIETSLAASLKRLRTDHVDVLALHDPDADEVTDSPVLAALARIKSRGQARALSVAGSAEVAALALRSSPLFDIAQISNDPFSQGVRRLRAVAPPSRAMTIGFGVFGQGGPLAELRARLDRDPLLLEAFGAAGYGEKATADVARAFLLDYALASNAEGVTLASMYARDHLDFNVARAARPVRPAVLDLARRFV